MMIARMKRTHFFKVSYIIEEMKSLKDELEATRSLLENTNLLVEILNDELVKKHRHIKHLKKEIFTGDTSSVINDNQNNEENEDTQNENNQEENNQEENNEYDTTTFLTILTTFITILTTFITILTTFITILTTFITIVFKKIICSYII